MSADDYRSKHDLIVQGQGVPDPIQSFDATGFQPGIMDEVHYSVQAGVSMRHLTLSLPNHMWLHEAPVPYVS